MAEAAMTQGHVMNYGVLKFAEPKFYRVVPCTLGIN